MFSYNQLCKGSEVHVFTEDHKFDINAVLVDACFHIATSTG